MLERSGDSSRRRVPVEQCQHQSGKALQHHSTFSIVLLMWQRSSSILLVKHTLRPSELLELKEEKSLSAPLDATSPYGRSVTITAFRNWSGHQGTSPRRVSPRWPNAVLNGQQALAPLKAGDPEERIWNFDNPAAVRMFKSATDSPGLSGVTMYQTSHSGAARYDKSCRLAADDHSLSHSRSETSWTHSRNEMSRHCWSRTIAASPPSHKRVTGKYMLDVFGGSGFLTKSNKSFGSAWLCARHEIWSQT